MQSDRRRVACLKLGVQVLLRRQRCHNEALPCMHATAWDVERGQTRLQAVDCWTPLRCGVFPASSSIISIAATPTNAKRLEGPRRTRTRCAPQPCAKMAVEGRQSASSRCWSLFLAARPTTRCRLPCSALHSCPVQQRMRAHRATPSVTCRPMFALQVGRAVAGRSASLLAGAPLRLNGRQHPQPHATAPHTCGPRDGNKNGSAPPNSQLNVPRLCMRLGGRPHPIRATSPMCWPLYASGLPCATLHATQALWLSPPNFGAPTLKRHSKL